MNREPLKHFINSLNKSALSQGISKKQYSKTWSLETLCGSMVEVSSMEAPAGLTVASQLVLEAQRQREPVTWLLHKSESFFPPDLYRTGIDLEALVVIRLGDRRFLLRAAETLLRSGAFGLIVIDLNYTAFVPESVLVRLVKLVTIHQAIVLFLTTKRSSANSLGSLIPLRAHAIRKKNDTTQFICEVQILKDKRRGPGWKHRFVCYGQDGLY